MKLTWSNRWAAAMASAVGLMVLAGCANTRYERSTGEFVDDKMLGKRVKHALNAQPVYKYPDVKVQTFRGIVQLSGFVATDAQRQAATDIVRQTRGAQRVENNILIAPLAGNSAADYIPGRQETNTAWRAESDQNRGTGAPSTQTGTTSGTVTNGTNTPR